MLRQLLGCLALVLFLVACAGDAQHITKAEEATAQGDVATAISEYTLAIEGEIQPEERFRALLGRADSHAAQEAWDAALADFAAALALTEGEKPVGAAVEVFSRRAELFIKQEDWAKAIEDLTRVLAAQPENYEALARRGYANLQQRNFEEAIADLKASLKGDIKAASADVDSEQNLYDAYFELGEALLRLGEYEESINAYNEALALADDSDEEVQMLTARGFAYDQMGDSDKALADLNRAIELDADYALAYAYRSGVSLSLGDYEEAITDANRAVEMGDQLGSNTRSVLLHSRALAHLSLGNYEQVIEDATASIELEGVDEPNTARTYDIRSDAHRYLGQYDEAIADATKAIELGASDVTSLGSFYQTRASAYYRAERYEEALADIEAALEIDGPSSKELEVQGDIYFAMGNNEQAIASYQEAIGLEPDDPWLHYYLADIHHEIEDLASAESEYRAALALNPEEPYFHVGLGIALRDQERYEEALEPFTTAIELDPDLSSGWVGRGLNYYYMREDALARVDLEQALTLEVSDGTRDFVQEILAEIQ
ncbi:MAG: tetratricopeptide repeat protein [Ardenticatenales bacterium]|nr:tetratricopeptide repeat protein [Ardenticatenales bacterium]